ncbi:uncharacterized protein Dwil_GK19244 [Drosophila willistoni]|uniref:Gustatory receptor n=1 Tax=Drosophila willistoni TaxID=7260 RepID=B4N1U1_DROWI|nr:gustatory receptor 10a [Drosophila willistoni]EDW78330.1 uncharacterized protein Dwil_GK19244 [Drosophila willistoni]
MREQPTDTTSEPLSFWDRHEYKIYKYGHIYAFIYGQVIIDYVPQKPMRAPLKTFLIAYSHVLSLMLIVVLPCYFGYYFRELTESRDRRMQLLLYVYFANTAIKYVTVIVTYLANMVHFTAINHRCTMQRLKLERAFARTYVHGSKYPKQRFEFFMYFKFCLINIMMVIQVCGIFAIYGSEAESQSHIRMHFAIYGFVLWNYTENMADYFYFINGSVLKYLRQLHIQVQMAWQDCCKLRQLHSAQMCDRLEELRRCFNQIYALHRESFRMHQLQLMGLMLATLINNLTNLFTIFNMLAKQTLEEISYPIVVSSLYALGFYIDTYIVTLLNEHIKMELQSLTLSMRRFSELETLDIRLDREIEEFSLLFMLMGGDQDEDRGHVMLCGMLHLDRRLVYLIAVTAFAYFITLVQFDLYLRKSKIN